MFSSAPPSQPSIYFRSHIPQTPSPLRTSQHANRMANATTNVRSSPLSDASTNDENWSPANNDTPATKYSTPMTNDEFAFTPTTSTFDFTPASSTSKPAFTFESRSRASSPAAQIQKHASEARDRRKTQFLDKIRTRRESARDERMGDQLLRMDYVKERKMWEEEMRRRAGEAEAETSEMEMEMELEEQSPTEEREIEELVSYFDNEADDGYNEAFMEVLLQQPQDAMDIS